MDYRIETDRPLGTEVRRIALECLDDADRRLASLDRDDLAATTDAIHESRKRCKEIRGLARLVRPGLGRHYRLVNDLARDAAKELSSLRDSHAQLATVESLQAHAGKKRARRLEPLREHQATLAEASARSIDEDDERIERARHLIAVARDVVAGWNLADGLEPFEEGLHRTYRRARSELKAVHRSADDERVHEWRKTVKYLWYQVRLLAEGDPGRFEALAADLHQLSDLLGDDHDLAVLVAHVGDEPIDGLDEETAQRAVRAARARQEVLRTEAIELGGVLLDRRPKRFVAGMIDPWRQVLVARRLENSEHTTVERERTFLVHRVPELGGPGSSIRQGYLALDGKVQVRIREVDGSRRTLTVKGGDGAVRTELEWKIGPERFDALWPFTRGRRLEKLRHRVPISGHTAEVDVFAGDLEGLILVEVEFDSDEEMSAFAIPDWFGPEVTDDRRYANAALATDGHVTGASVAGV